MPMTSPPCKTSSARGTTRERGARSRLRRMAAVAVALLAVLLPSAPPASAIFDGLPSAEGEFPFMASLSRTDKPGNARDTHFCGGTLIERNWILTAAHCVVDLTPQQIRVVIGRTRLTSSAGEVRGVSTVVRHPEFRHGWDSTPDNDVALLKLSTPSALTPLRLASSNNRNTWLTGGNVTTMGWGATTWTGDELGGTAGGFPDILQVRGLRLADDAAARATYATYRAETMITAGVSKGGAGICHQDSGGPLIAYGQGTPRLVGVNSFGKQNRCGLAVTGSGFARVGEGPLSRWIIEQVPSLANDGWTTRSGDFDGDGKDDVAAFLRGVVQPGSPANYSAWVALSDPSGDGPFGPPSQWASSLVDTDQVPLVGDFDGNHRDDIVVFTRGNVHTADVALSTGRGFAPKRTWHTWFTPNNEIPAVGDVDGDGKDDIVAFPRGPNGDAWVALSNGGGFGPARFWGNSVAFGNEIPALADVDGDRRADAITFTRGVAGDVWVSLSTGGGFGPPQRWHENFAFGAEIPAVGDFDGDDKADIATFTRGGRADVFVAISNGSTGFTGTAAVWNSDFAAYNEIPGVGDFDGDGKDDIAAFTRGNTADVYVSRSNGGGFADIHLKWHEWVVAGGEVPAGASAW